MAYQNVTELAVDAIKQKSECFQLTLSRERKFFLAL